MANFLTEKILKENRAFQSMCYSSTVLHCLSGTLDDFIEQKFEFHHVNNLSYRIIA